MNHCIVLFFQFCKFSVLCFGGGYMLIPLLTAEFVDREQVLTMSEFGNLLSVAQVTPGPVGLNTATYVGYVNEGFFGSLAASLGLIAPTIVIGCSAAAGIARWKDKFVVKGMLKGTRLAAVPFGWCYVWWQTRRMSRAEEAADGGNTAGTSAETASAETHENGVGGK